MALLTDQKSEGKAEGITCFLFNDLPAWEREGVLPILNELARHHSVKVVEVRESHRGSLRRSQGVSWVISKNWERALRFLSASKSKGMVYASVFGLTEERRALPLLFWKRLNRSLPNHVHLIAHSPLNFRFFLEIEAFPESRVSFLHLPFSIDLAEKFARRPEKHSVGFRVGTFAPFTSKSNLNYFLNVAHYVVRRRSEARFRIFGAGELYGHLSELVRELDLDDHVTIVETYNTDEIDALDLLLFTPLRNDHFLPVLTAAAAGLPVLASEVPGISDFIDNGKNGFIFPINETVPMGETAIRLLDHTILRRSLSDELRKSTAEKFSTRTLSEKYASLFLSKDTSKQNQKDVSRAA